MSTVRDPVALWLSFKRVGEVNRARVLADVIEHAPVTEGELTVLMHLDAADGAMRQNALAAAAGWDRTRLSHLLTRMEERGYLTRHRLHNGVEITLLGPGRARVDLIRTALGGAVDRHFGNRLSSTQLGALEDILNALDGRTAAGPHSAAPELTDLA